MEDSYSNKFGSLMSDDDSDTEIDLDTLEDKKKKIQKPSNHSHMTTTVSKKKGNLSQTKPSSNNQKKLSTTTSSSSNGGYNIIYGENAKAEIELLRKKITIRDIQHYILWILLDFKVSTPNWIFTKSKPLIEKVVVVNIHSISDLLYTKFKYLMGKPLFSSIFPNEKSNKVEVLLPNQNHIYDHLLNIRETVKEKEKSKSQLQKQKSTQIDPPDYYLLNDEDLIVNGYPSLKVLTDEQGWSRPTIVTTTTTASTTTTTTTTTSKEQVNEVQSPILLAIDCEMCRTTVGLELTRISIVNEKKQVLLDEYVKPLNPITDYLTQYSGISEEILKDVTTRLPDIHEKLNKLITSDTILIGHSLENDLIAMKYYHNKIIDTAVMYPTGSGSKFPLKYLTSKHLHRTIQSGVTGHDSIEDAKAVMDLVKLKLVQGRTFGTKQENFVSLFQRIHSYEKKSIFIDQLEEIKTYTTPSVSCIHTATDQEVIEKSIKQIKNNNSHFICLQLNALKNHFISSDQNHRKSSLFNKIKQEQEQELIFNVNNSNNITTTTTKTTTTTTVVESIISNENNNNNNNKLDKEDEKILKELQQIDGIVIDSQAISIAKVIEQQVKQIYDNLPNNTLFLLLLGPGPHNDLNKYKNDPAKKHEFLMAIETSKEALAYVSIK